MTQEAKMRRFEVHPIHACERFLFSIFTTSHQSLTITRAIK